MFELLNQLVVAKELRESTLKVIQSKIINSISASKEIGIFSALYAFDSSVGIDDLNNIAFILNNKGYRTRFTGCNLIIEW